MEELYSHRQIAGLEIRRVPLASLHADPSNARSHPDANLEAIVASLQRFAQVEPLVVQKATGRVVGGNGRLTAMKRLGWTECDVVEVELDDLQATALAIALNRTAELAEWDEPTLARLLREIRAGDSLVGVGFSDAEVDELIAELLADEERGEVNDPGPGEPPEHPVSRLGDLWLLGQHKLLCGDSTNVEHMARLMAGETATLCATDSPYLVSYDGTNHPAEHHRKAGRKDPPGGEVGNKHWDEYIDPETSVAFFSDFLRVALAHCTERVPVYCWHATRRQALMEQAWEQNNLLIHQTIIWSKTRGVLTRSHFLWKHEPCFYGWRQGMQPEKERRPPPNETTIWELESENDGIHPTQKPTEVFARPIEWHTTPGEVVLESFSGSGTQIIAAEKLARRCRAMELSPAFVDVAVKRWQGATGREATLDGDGRSFAAISAERGAEMVKRIPPEAFDFYVNLGPARSYRAVAERYGVSKRAITKYAARDNWPGRLSKVEADAREQADKKLVDSLEEMRERHQRILKFMAGRALEALKRFPLTTGMEGSKVGAMVIKLERIAAGEPSERTALSVEEVTRREIQTLLVREGSDAADDSW